VTPPLSTSDSKQIAKKSIHGVFWNYTSFGAGKALVFITTAILARLLTPDDFGVVALATLAVSYLSILKDLGLGAALIQRRRDVEESANTVFTLNLLLGAGLTLAAMASAPLIANFFQEPLVTPILRWLSLTFVLNSLGAIHLVRLQRELEFRRKLIPDMGRSVVKGVVSIGMALSGFGVWALVVGQLAGVLVAVFLAWIAFPWRPKLTINTSLVKGLSKYGLSVVGVDALTIAADNLDYLIVGRIFGNTALGIYTLAYRLPELLVLNPLWVMAKAIFPAYASVQKEPELLRRGFLSTVRFVEILTVPLSLGLLLTADPLVRVAFGDQWLEAIPIVRILAVVVLVRATLFNAGDVYKAIGRPDIILKLELLNTVVLIPALWIGSYYGIVGVAFGHLAASAVRPIADIILAPRYVDTSHKEILAQLKPSLIAGLCLILLTVPSLYLTAAAPPVLRLGIAAIAGGIGYLGPLWFLERETLLQVRQIVGLSGSKGGLS
jgi:O-antigen/teichoic acid export membrane protein